MPKNYTINRIKKGLSWKKKKKNPGRKETMQKLQKQNNTEENNKTSEY